MLAEIFIDRLSANRRPRDVEYRFQRRVTSGDGAEIVVRRPQTRANARLVDAERQQAGGMSSSKTSNGVINYGLRADIVNLGIWLAKRSHLGRSRRSKRLISINGRSRAAAGTRAEVKSPDPATEVRIGLTTLSARPN